ncbi:MAG: efflux RND transporter periplasmic adaptor subunit [Vulcanimicrobiaceae bacterium]
MKGRVLALAVAVGVALSGCSGGKKAQDGPPPLAVDVAKAQQRDIATYIMLDGQIAPLQQSILSSSQSGTVTSVYVNEGDRVTKGELLAQLDDSQLRAQLAANQATVSQSDAKLRSSAIQAPISSQQYNSGLSAAQQALQQAQNRVSTDVAALNNAELVYKSNQQLATQGYVAQTTLEQSRATYVAAVQELHNARQALPPAQAALTSARENLQQTGVDQATIAANKAALDQARANVQLLQTQIVQSAVYAPFDGVVTQRLLDPGAFAGPNQAIVQVSQIDHVYVNANVPDDNLSYVRPGTPASFVSSSLPGRTFHGTIADVNAVPTSGTLSYRARIHQPNPGGELRGGMLVTMTVQKERHPNAIVVPRTALFQTDQGSSVYTVEDGKAKMLPVEVGLQTDTLAEVRSPDVRAGTVVITTRPDALQDGSVVAIAGPAGGSPNATASPAH